MSWLTFLPDIISGTASIFGSIMGSHSSSSNTSRTNDTNLAIARETNETNQQIQRDTNAANIAMNTANNQLQMQLQREMNEYNSIGSQLERGAKAGVNPNTILGGVSGNLQSTLPSVTAGHADMTPVQGVTLENPASEKLGIINSLISAGSAISQAQLNKANTNKVEQETEWWKTEAKFAEQVKRFGLDLTKQQIANAKVECDKLAQDVENSKITFEQLKVQLSMMNDEAKMKAYEALNYPQWYDSQLKILMTEADYSEEMARYSLEKLKADLQVSKDQSALIKAQSALTASQRQLVDEQYEIAKEGKKQAVYETYLQKTYEGQRRWNEVNNLRHEGRLKGSQKRATDAGANNMEWENSGFRRGVRTTGDIIHSANEAVNTVNSISPRSQKTYFNYNQQGQLTGKTSYFE